MAFWPKNLILTMHHEIPVPTIQLIPLLDELLIELLESLHPDDWSRKTLAPAWNVKDVAAHLLDGNIRSLSSSRDGFNTKTTISTDNHDGVVRFLNTINNDWVTVMKRVSPSMLISLLSLTNKLYSDHLSQLDPFEKSIYPVSWAGQSESQNWFHIAREYTEKWHHQQQIREATGHSPVLFAKAFFKPYIDTSLIALPYHFRNLKAEEGDTFSLIITGEGGGEWHFIYQKNVWATCLEKPSYSVAKVHIDDRVIWRLFSKQISADELKNRTMISGRKDIAEAFLTMTAVMV